jgi:hypothetical protein
MSDSEPRWPEGWEKQKRPRNVRAALEPFELPEGVAKWISRIARRTRLTRRERIAVAIELAQEARSRLDAGDPIEVVVVGMGNVRAIARQMRGEAMTRRSWPRRVWTRLWRRAKYALLVLLLGYVATVVYFHIGTPRVKRNFSAEFNARFAGVPEEQKGINELRRAVELYVQEPDELKARWPDFEPDDPEWPAVLEYLAKIDPMLEHVRAAAAKPVFGMEMFDAVDPTLSLLPEDRGKTREAGSENPYLLDLMLGHLGLIRKCTRALSIDARAAAEAGQSGRVAADVKAILGLSGHARECETMIGDLVGVACMAVDVTVVGRVLAEHPGLLNDRELAEISGAFEGFAGGKLTVRTSDTRAVIEDMLQRVYTDDGRGSGRLCWQGVRALQRIGGHGGEPEFWVHFVSPISNLSKASRKELSDEAALVLGLAEADAVRPRWERLDYAVQREIDRLENDPVLSGRFAMVLAVAPAIKKSIEAFSSGEQARDGVLTAIALERFRLARGVYPSELSQLVPEFLARVPLDSYDGKPLKYHLADSGPLLYAVGCDTDDDGGRVPEGWRGNDKAMPWRTPDKRHLCGDGDLVLWPPVPEPRKRPDDE